MTRVTLSDRRNIQTDPAMFDERLRLQQHGFTLCEQRDDAFISRFCEIQFGKPHRRVTDWTRPTLPFFSFETDVQSTWVP